jgi:hypothetical protein
MMRSMAMSVDSGVGEARERARSRRWRNILLGAGAMGLIPGFLLGYSLNDSILDPSTTWPGWIAIMLAVTYLIAVTVGSWLLYRQVDELQRQVYGKAAMVAASAVIILYPVWWILWMGALAPEPIHWVIFLTLYVIYAGGSLYYRYR